MDQEVRAESADERWVAVWQELTSVDHNREEADSERAWWSWSYIADAQSATIGSDSAAHLDNASKVPIRIQGLAFLAMLVFFVLCFPDFVSTGGFDPVPPLGFLLAWLVLTAARVYARLAARARRKAASAVRPITVDMFRSDPGDADRAAGVSTEGRLVAVATAVARDIEASDAWHSSSLDAQRVRVDLAGSVRQLADRAARLHTARDKLGRRPSDDAVPAGSVQLWEEQCHIADQVRSSLVGHVEALIDYREQVTALSRELAVLDKVSGVSGGAGGSNGGDVTGELAGLLASSSSEHDAAYQLRELSEHTRANVDAINDVIAILDRNLSRLEQG